MIESKYGVVKIEGIKPVIMGEWTHLTMSLIEDDTIDFAELRCCLRDASDRAIDKKYEDEEKRKDMKKAELKANVTCDLKILREKYEVTQEEIDECVEFSGMKTGELMVKLMTDLLNRLSDDGDNEKKGDE